MITTLISLAIVATQTSVSVDGEGYLRFVRDGKSIYAKEAVLSVNDGKLAHSAGYAVSPRIQVNGTPTALRVDLEGFVFGTYSGAEQQLGRMVLAIFPDDVRPVVDKGFIISSFRPTLANPGSDNAGVIRSGSGAPTVVPKTATPVATTPSGTVTITLRASAEVTTDTFTLADIADVSADAATKLRLEALELSNTPALSGVYKMSHSMVTSRILRHDKKAKEYEILGATQVAVSRKGQTITHDQFVAAATQAAKAELGDNIMLRSSRRQSSLIAPMGELELHGESFSSNGSRISVIVAIYVDGKRINSRTVSLENHNPIAKMRVGQNVKVLVASNGASIQTNGKIKSIDIGTNTVLVLTVTGAELLCTVIDSNTVEKKL